MSNQHASINKTAFATHLEYLLEFLGLDIKLADVENLKVSYEIKTSNNVGSLIIEETHQKGGMGAYISIKENTLTLP